MPVEVNLQSFGLLHGSASPAAGEVLITDGAVQRLCTLRITNLLPDRKH